MMLNNCLGTPEEFGKWFSAVHFYETAYVDLQALAVCFRQAMWVLGFPSTCHCKQRFSKHFVAMGRIGQNFFHFWCVQRQFTFVSNPSSTFVLRPRTFFQNACVDLCLAAVADVCLERAVVVTNNSAQRAPAKGTLPSRALSLTLLLATPLISSHRRGHRRIRALKRGLRSSQPVNTPMISPVLPPITKACPESELSMFPLERPFHPMSNDPTRSWQFLSLGSRGERAISFSEFSNVTCDVTSHSCLPTIVSISSHARPVIKLASPGMPHVDSPPASPSPLLHCMASTALQFMLL
jgi:hypothetical protein